MAYFYNTFEGGTNGSNISAANSGAASGNAFSFIFIANASTPSGGTSIKYSTTAALSGNIGALFAPVDAGNYLRWDTAGGGARGVARCGIYIGSIPSTQFTFMEVRNSTTNMGAVCFRNTGVIRAVNRTGAAITESTFNASINTLYWVEVAATKSTDGTDGRIELKVFAADGTTQLFSWDSGATQDTGTTNVQQVRFKGLDGTASTTASYIDDVQFDSDKPSGWLGPLSLANNSPTVGITPATQNIAASASVSLSANASDLDGTITSHTWAFDYPMSGTPSLTGGATSSPSFTAGVAGSLYVLRDTVSDNGGATAYSTAEVRVPTTGSATALASYTPIGTAWSVAGGATDEGTALSDGSGSTYVESPDITASSVERRWRIQPMSIRTGYRFTLLGISITAVSSHSSKIRVYQGNTLVTERATSTLKKVSDGTTTDITTTPTDLYLDLTTDEVSAITDPGNLWIAIQTVA